MQFCAASELGGCRGGCEGVGGVVGLGLGFLVLAFAEEPEEDADEGDGERDSDCAADYEADVVFL